MMGRANPFATRRGTGGRLLGFLLVLTLVAGCDESGNFNMKDAFKSQDEAGTEARSAAPGSVVERDVEAPDVFSTTEEGLWDGRPSLGGVWVAHPDVNEPERVMIRNMDNGKSVVGALFRRERDIPGPRLQLSSDAATSLSVLAGAPVRLSVVALRRETVAEPAPADSDVAVPEPAAVAEALLDPVAATAGAAIEAAAPAAGSAPAAPVESDLPLKRAAPSPAPKSSIDKPFLQIGIFSVEANAERAAQQMRAAGMVPEVKKQSAGGKTFWRVLVGPASSTSERNALLGKIKGEGYSDAYAVAN